MSETSDDDSPCIRVCAVNASGVCTGCGRTLEEIAGWQGMSEGERRATNRRARARLAGSRCARPSRPVPGRE